MDLRKICDAADGWTKVRFKVSADKLDQAKSVLDELGYVAYDVEGEGDNLTIAVSTQNPDDTKAKIEPMLEKAGVNTKVTDSNKRLDEYILWSLRASGLETTTNVGQHKDGIRVSLQGSRSVYADFYLDGESLQVKLSDAARGEVADAWIDRYARFAGIPKEQAKNEVWKFVKWYNAAVKKNGSEPKALQSVKVTDATEEPVNDLAAIEQIIRKNLKASKLEGRFSVRTGNKDILLLDREDDGMGLIFGFTQRGGLTCTLLGPDAKAKNAYYGKNPEVESFAHKAVDEYEHTKVTDASDSKAETFQKFLENTFGVSARGNEGWEEAAVAILYLLGKDGRKDFEKHLRKLWGFGMEPTDESYLSGRILDWIDSEAVSAKRVVEAFISYASDEELKLTEKSIKSAYHVKRKRSNLNSASETVKDAASNEEAIEIVKPLLPEGAKAEKDAQGQIIVSTAESTPVVILYYNKRKSLWTGKLTADGESTPWAEAILFRGTFKLNEAKETDKVKDSVEDLKLPKFSSNTKLNKLCTSIAESILARFTDDSTDTMLEELEMYKNDFPYELGYNYVQHGNTGIIYYTDAQDELRDAGYNTKLSDEQAWNAVCRACGQVIRILLEHKDELLAQKVTDADDDLKLPKFSGNAKFDNLCKRLAKEAFDTYDNNVEETLSDLQRYKSDFPNEPDYNFMQYGGTSIISFEDAQEAMTNAGYPARKDARKAWDTVLKVMGTTIDILLSHKDELLKQKVTDAAEDKITLADFEKSDTLIPRKGFTQYMIKHPENYGVRAITIGYDEVEDTWKYKIFKDGEIIVGNNFDYADEALDNMNANLASKVSDAATTDYIFPASSTEVNDNKGHFPIPDVAHGRNALAQVAKYDALPKWYTGKMSLPEFKKHVRSAVEKAFPSIEAAKVKDDEGFNYTVGLWPGSGYGFLTYNVKADSEEEALDKAVAKAIENGDGTVITEEDFQTMIDEGDVEDLGDGEYEGYMYIDATMEGAPYPVWIRSDNLKIIEGHEVVDSADTDGNTVEYIVMQCNPTNEDQIFKAKDLKEAQRYFRENCLLRGAKRAEDEHNAYWYEIVKWTYDKDGEALDAETIRVSPKYRFE